jgi:hypothetical protein
MCALCFAQGIGYVGGALGYLQVKSAGISIRRRAAARSIDANVEEDVELGVGIEAAVAEPALEAAEDEATSVEGTSADEELVTVDA